MRDVLLYADQGSWLQLPATFPTEDGELPREWENNVVGRMREAWPEGMDADSEVLVREALQFGLRRVLPEDSLTLQYWPSPTIVNAVVHIAARESEPGDASLGVPLDEELTLLTRPAASAFASDHLGTGIEVRYLSVVEDGDQQLALGGVNYLFRSASGVVFVGLEPTLPQLMGAMLDPLRDVVRSVRVTGDGNDAWEKADIDPDVLEPYAESWDLEDAGEAGGR